MAITCAYCGQTLQRDNARFCNSCGAPVHHPPQHDQRGAARELHVKIWKNKEQGDSSFSEEDTIFPDESAIFPEDSIEDLPTVLLEANTPNPRTQKPPGIDAGDVINRRAAINRAPTIQDAHLDDVAQLPTSRLVSQRQMKPEEALRQAGLVPQPLSPVSIATRPVSRQGMSRTPLAIVLVLLFILIAGGIVAWIITFQPFAVASITQPWQQFCDAGIGVSGQYPTGWMKQVDQKKAVRFSDGTDQFNIVSVTTNGQDAGKYLQQEASQLGITGLKSGTPLSFAGASWQQAQGSLLQSQTGVTYTETLLVTMRSNRLFTIVQVAPPGTYSEEDKTIFTGMRSSFQFSNSCP